ncbi:MAG: Smr/MutS family protein [Maritimibacter sp.]|nr:Smr/MutS family protein [Maritimibacter sp.]
MPPRKPRKIRPDELDLWNKVVQHAEPMHPNRPLPTEPTPAEAKPAPVKQGPAMPAQKSFRVGEAAPQRGSKHDLASGIEEHMRQHPVRMDPKRYGQMKKGRLTPEARIDLHGMTLAQAHPALMRFILEAAAEERRLVLVITGKGKVRDESGPIPERHGVLRHQVPHWLNSMPLKLYVLQIAEAHLKHGGSGAYYVYLRRSRG